MPGFDRSTSQKKQKQTNNKSKPQPHITTAYTTMWGRKGALGCAKETKPEPS